jgi:hypothetical protein
VRTPALHACILLHCTALHCTDALPCSSDIFRSFDIYCTALVLMSLLCVALLHFQAWAPGAALDMGGNLLQRYEGGTYHCTAEICPQVCDEENHIVSSVFFSAQIRCCSPFNARSHGPTPSKINIIVFFYLCLRMRTTVPWRSAQIVSNGAYCKSLKKVVNQYGYICCCPTSVFSVVLIHHACLVET